VTAPEAPAEGTLVAEPVIDLDEEDAVVPYGRIGAGSPRRDDQPARRAIDAGRAPVTPRR